MNNITNADTRIDGQPREPQRASPIKTAWHEAEVIFDRIRADPQNPAYRGTFTAALFRTRDEFAGKSLIEATARVIVHRTLREPHVKRDRRRNTEKWMQYHYDLANVETDLTGHITQEKLLEKFVVEGSATRYLFDKGFNPAARRAAGAKAAKLESFLSGMIKNAIIDYLWTLECVESPSDLLATGHSSLVVELDPRIHDEAQPGSGALFEDLDEFDGRVIAAEFLSYLPDEAHRSVFWLVVMNRHSVHAAAQRLGIGVNTCSNRLDEIEALWKAYQMLGLD